MSWRDDVQRARVCIALLSLVGMEELWEPEGPSSQAVEWYQTGRNPLSSGESILFAAAWDVWNGEGNASLGELLSSLSPPLLKKVAKLVTAYATGPAAIDRWVAEVWEGR